MRLALTTSLSVLSLSSVALSCSCFSTGGCPGLGGKAGPVFLGTVLAVTDLPRTDDDVFLSSRRARIQVDESFGGLSPDVHEVDVLTGAGGGDCGIPFRAGDVYLIDAFVEKDGLVHAGICSATRKIDAAGVALRILRQQRDGQRVPTLTGQIAQHDRNFEGTLGTHAPKPQANALVRVKADGRVYETLADSEGLYAFYNLPSGRYEFAPELPAGTTLSWYIGSDRPLGPFEVNAGACHESNIEVFASGSIQGRILDSQNKLLPHAFVYIVPADRKVLPEERQLYWESQGKEDFFKFVHIPPGQYLILVNPDDSRNPEFPYRRTFYPGVHDRASAAIITLRGGEQIKDADIRLEQQFAARHVTVRVTWADGRLIRDFVFVEAKGTVNPAAMSDTSQPDMKASVVDLNVLPNEPYAVEGELTCRYADERSMGPGATLKSNKVYLGPGDDRTELFLTIPATACPEIHGKTLLTDQ
jgi:hypothetical protein